MGSHTVILTHAKIPGRIRYSVPDLVYAEPLGQLLENYLVLQIGIRKVNINPITGSVLIHYKNSQIKPFQIIKSIKEFLKSQYDGFHTQGNHWSGKSLNNSWHTYQIEEIEKKLGTSRAKGLKKKILLQNQKRYGRNIIPFGREKSKLSIFIHQYQNLPSKLLIGSTFISIITGGVADSIVIGIVLILNGYIGYTMERSSEKIIRSLTKININKVRIKREGITMEIDPSQLTLGDIFEIGPGMTVPADARLIEVQSLMVDESILTGESLPVAKSVEVVQEENIPLGDRKNMIFRGTVVTGGSAIAVVVSIGHFTELGKIRELIEKNVQPQSQLEKQLEHLGNQMAVTAISAAGIVLILGIIRKYPFLHILKSAISMTVAAIPESLPTVATTTVASGLLRLKSKDIIVRNWGALETLATVDHICLDKTGTLTMNKMAVTEAITASGHFLISDKNISRDGKKILLKKFPSLNNLMKVAVLCNEAELLKEGEKISANGSSTEGALLKMAYQCGLNFDQLRNENPLLNTSYRTEKRNYMMTEHLRKMTKRNWIAVKGSPTEVLALCKTYQKGNKVYRINEKHREIFSKWNDQLAHSGLRVLGFASGKDNDHLSWLGVVGMSDPIREGMKELIPVFHRVGIELSMVTGDQKATAEAIGKQIGIDKVYSRVSPSEKLSIVKDIRTSQKKIVGMIGDGVNDGPALKVADVGIAMAARGSDTATQAADIVLPSNNIQGLITAIQEGRTIHKDIKKAANYAVSKNLSEIIFTLVVMIFSRCEPLSPIQFLWINLITDTLPELALAQELSPLDVLSERPSAFRKKIIAREDISKVILDSSLLSIAPGLSYALGKNGHGSPQNASALAFLTMAGSSLLYTLNSRSNQVTIAHYDELPENNYIPAAIGAGILAQILGIMFPPLRRLLGVGSLTKKEVIITFLGSTLPMITIEMGKILNRRSIVPLQNPNTTLIQRRHKIWH